MKQTIFILVTTLFCITTFAKEDLSKELNSLGGNKELIQKAKAMDPNNKVRIVQNRAVDRSMRLELGVNYGLVSGGDPYVSSNNLGGNIDFHITPHWSLGARYYQTANHLSSEGKNVFDRAEQARRNGDSSAQNPQVVYAKETVLGVVNWYPLYGKLNLFDWNVAQFDIYALAGYGQVRLSSGTSPTWTAGGGLGLWLSQHIASRFEVRYQTYQDEVYNANRDIDLTVITFSLGVLL